MKYRNLEFFILQPNDEELSITFHAKDLIHCLTMTLHVTYIPKVYPTSLKIYSYYV